MTTVFDVGNLDDEVCCAVLRTPRARGWLAVAVVGVYGRV